MLETFKKAGFITLITASLFTSVDARERHPYVSHAQYHDDGDFLFGLVAGVAIGTMISVYNEPRYYDRPYYYFEGRYYYGGRYINGRYYHHNRVLRGGRYYYHHPRYRPVVYDRYDRGRDYNAYRPRYNHNNGWSANRSIERTSGSQKIERTSRPQQSDHSRDQSKGRQRENNNPGGWNHHR